MRFPLWGRLQRLNSKNKNNDNKQKLEMYYKQVDDMIQE
jgi:hypothetical protein